MNTKKSIFKKSERGQAIVLLAAGMVAFLAMIALAIDGSSAYTERRHAQDAADSAALAGALAKIRTDPDWEDVARHTAAMNGFEDDDKTTVEIYSPPQSGPYADDDEYVQVIINVDTQSYFAQIVGHDSEHNRVEAIAHANAEPIAAGFAAFATNEHDDNAIQVSSEGIIFAAGRVFSNSDSDKSIVADSEDLFFTTMHGEIVAVNPIDFGSGFSMPMVGNILTDFCMPAPMSTMMTMMSGMMGGGGTSDKIQAVGDVVNPSGFAPPPMPSSFMTPALLPGPTTGVSHKNLPDLPAPDCSALPNKGNADLEDAGSIFHPITLSPGQYGHITISGNSFVHFEPGLYCISDPQGFQIAGEAGTSGGGGGWWGSGGSSTPDKYAVAEGLGVTFYLEQGPFTVGDYANATFFASVPPFEWGGMLIYMDKNNASGVHVHDAELSSAAEDFLNNSPWSSALNQGLNHSMLVGSVYAPDSACNFQGLGTTGAFGFKSQLLCNTIHTSQFVTLCYDEKVVYKTTTLELVK